MLDEASGVPANDASTDGIGTACTCSGSHFPARRGVHARYGCRCNTTANDGARIGIVCLASHQLPNVAPESSQTGAFPLQATARFHSSEPHPDLSFGSPSRFSFLFFSFPFLFLFRKKSAPCNSIWQPRSLLTIAKIQCTTRRSNRSNQPPKDTAQGGWLTGEGRSACCLFLGLFWGLALALQRTSG